MFCVFMTLTQWKIFINQDPAALADHQVSSIKNRNHDDSLLLESLNVLSVIIFHFVQVKYCQTQVLCQWLTRVLRASRLA